jgi:hypothetical protein
MSSYPLPRSSVFFTFCLGSIRLTRTNAQWIFTKEYKPLVYLPLPRLIVLRSICTRWPTSRLWWGKERASPFRNSSHLMYIAHMLLWCFMGHQRHIMRLHSPFEVSREDALHFPDGLDTKPRSLALTGCKTANFWNSSLISYEIIVERGAFLCFLWRGAQSPSGAHPESI